MPDCAEGGGDIFLPLALLERGLVGEVGDVILDGETILVGDVSVGDGRS